MANQKPNTVTIPARLSYVNLFQPKPPFNNPGGDPKFSVTCLVPKTDLAAKDLIDKAVNYAIETGVNTRWNGVRPPQPAICVHDGDGPRPSDGSAFGPECRGMWVFTASCKADRPPFVMDRRVQPILDPTQVYSGMWGNVSVTFFAYNSAGKKGIGCGLNGVQKVRDDEPLGSVVTAQDAFKPIEDDDPAMGAGPAYGQPAAPQPGMGYAVPMSGQAYASPAPADPQPQGYSVPMSPAARAFQQAAQNYAPQDADPWGM